MAAVARAIREVAPDALFLDDNFERGVAHDTETFTGQANAHDPFYPRGYRMRTQQVVSLTLDLVTGDFVGALDPVPGCDRKACVEHGCSCRAYLEFISAERPAVFASTRPDLKPATRAELAQATEYANVLLAGVPLGVHVSVPRGGSAYQMTYLWERHGASPPQASEPSGASLPVLRTAYRLTDPQWDIYWPPYPVDDRLLVLGGLDLQAVTRSPRDSDTWEAQQPPLLRAIADAVRTPPCCISAAAAASLVQRRKQEWDERMPIRTAYTAMVLALLQHREAPVDSAPAAKQRPSVGHVDAAEQAVLDAHDKSRFDYDLRGAQNVGLTSELPTIRLLAGSLATSMYASVCTRQRISLRVSVADAAAQGVTGVRAALTSMRSVAIHMSLLVTYVAKRAS